MKYQRRVFLLCSVLGLAACSDQASLKRELGYTRSAPDEFLVTTRAPLAMPPSFSLPTPQPGAGRPQELPLSRQAEAVLAPDSILQNSDQSQTAGEKQLVSAAGPKATKNIRHLVDEETANAGDNQSMASSLMFWQAPPPKGVVVNPDEEKARLANAPSQPPAPQPAAAPVQASDSHGWFDWLF